MYIRTVACFTMPHSGSTPVSNRVAVANVFVSGLLAKRELFLLGGGVNVADVGEALDVSRVEPCLCAGPSPTLSQMSHRLKERGSSVAMHRAEPMILGCVDMRRLRSLYWVSRSIWCCRSCSQSETRSNDPAECQAESGAVRSRIPPIIRQPLPQPNRLRAAAALKPSPQIQ
jgi:hypothetical protein